MKAKANKKLEQFLEMDLSEANPKLKEVQSILKRKNINLGRLMEEACKNCGEKEVYCGHADLGTVDYYDNFWHICLSCLDVKHKETYTGNGQEIGGETNCFFCGYQRG